VIVATFRFQALKVSLQYGAIDHMQIIRNGLAGPGNGALEWRNLADVHNGANVTKVSAINKQVLENMSFNRS